MKTAGLVFLNLGVTIVVVAAAHALLSPAPADPRAAALPRGASEATVRALGDRLDRVEARVDEIAASLDGLRKEMAETRRTVAESQAQAEKDRMEGAAALTRLVESAKAGDGGKKPEMDAFAKEVSKAMKQGVRQEFKRISDLVTSPTPEALDQRKRQLKMFAGMMGASAGLDQGQIATFEQILGDTDDRAREDLRPLLLGVEDYRQVDYGKVRKITTDSFAAQNERIDQEFPKDKSERLKQQLEPIRGMFSATIDSLEKESTAAPAEPPK